MAAINLNTLLTGQDSGGTWSTTSFCGDMATNPDTVDLSDPTSVDFTGKVLGTYTFYYSFAESGCTSDCTEVTVEAIDCCDLVINSAVISEVCPFELVVNYTTNSTASQLYAILEHNGVQQYRRKLDPNMVSAGTHTLTITDIPCVSQDETWEFKLCCTNQSQLGT